MSKVLAKEMFDELVHDHIDKISNTEEAEFSNSSIERVSSPRTPKRKKENKTV